MKERINRRLVYIKELLIFLRERKNPLRYEHRFYAFKIAYGRNCVNCFDFNHPIQILDQICFSCRPFCLICRSEKQLESENQCHDCIAKFCPECGEPNPIYFQQGKFKGKCLDCVTKGELNPNHGPKDLL